jgi:hypothetical protein
MTLAVLMKVDVDSIILRCSSNGETPGRSAVSQSRSLPEIRPLVEPFDAVMSLVEQGRAPRPGAAAMDLSMRRRSMLN